ncbi:MAG: lipoate--protein ligase family protein [Leptolyngbya sp. SIOISBB]|nr:lipoate--protein ligase family protein [Leptolyngbya sp. SIOISBB]
MNRQGRLIPSMTAAGASHMAIDSWMLDQLIDDNQPPILRFYRWSTASISLGYHQKQWPQHWQHLTWQSQTVELVRRPTGGRAVLHQGDLTYAIVLPLVGKRQDAYQQICNALISAWQRLEVPLDYGTAGHSYRYQDNCFALSTPADLVTASGEKLIGSAQLRRDRYLLQHGSIQLWPEPTLYQQVFGTDAMPPQHRPSTIPAQPHDQFLETLEELIQAELMRSLQIEFTPQPLSPLEQTEIAARSARFAIPVDSSPKQAT